MLPEEDILALDRALHPTRAERQQGVTGIDRWSALMRELAREKPADVKFHAETIIDQARDHGFPRSELALAASHVVQVIGMGEALDRAAGSPAPDQPVRAVRSSSKFYRTPRSWHVTGSKPFTPP